MFLSSISGLGAAPAVPSCIVVAPTIVGISDHEPLPVSTLFWSPALGLGTTPDVPSVVAVAPVMAAVAPDGSLTRIYVFDVASKR